MEVRQRKEVMVVVLMTPSCGHWETKWLNGGQRRTCQQPVFSKEANAVETEVEFLSTILLSVLGAVHVVGIGCCGKYNNTGYSPLQNLKHWASQGTEAHLVVCCYSNRTNGATEARTGPELIFLIQLCLCHLGLCERCNLMPTKATQKMEAEGHWWIASV